ncbi:MAG: type transport system permease protein [Solirubrobacteraceae bacterium]|jgi:ABC-2 type transport system permease protein|nr:type transport system permease protein [Solirubrobacteraceae bacterium]
MSGRSAIALVARREIVERLRERSLLISTLVTITILAAIIVVPSAIGLGATKTHKVAVAGPRAERLARAAQPAARPLKARIEIVRVADDAAVRRAVRSDDADAGITRAADAIVAHKQIDDNLGVALQEGARLLRLREPPPAPLPVRSLEAVDRSADQQQSLAFVAVLMLYGQLITYGFWLAGGIVEEKSSRIVEVLLAAITPRQLLAGKILGIGLVGLGELLLIGVTGAALAIATGTLDLAGDAVSALAIVLAWFVLGYAFYSCMFAVAGALVPRQEDIQNSTGPLTIVLIGSFLLSFAAIDDPGGSLATALSFVPATAPMIAPVRLIAGEMPLVQVVLSVAVLAACTAALVSAAARIYANAVLRTGTRVKLRDAWHAPQS